MIHAAANLHHARTDGHLQRKELILPVTKPETPVPIVAPHVQIIPVRYRSAMGEAAVNRPHSRSWVEVVPAEEGGRDEARSRLVDHFRSEAQDAVTPGKHVTGFVERQAVGTTGGDIYDAAAVPQEGQMTGGVDLGRFVAVWEELAVLGVAPAEHFAAICLKCREFFFNFFNFKITHQLTIQR